MTDIIFAYQQGETNWLNPEWRKAKIAENKKRDIMFVENNFPEYTDNKKAMLIGMKYTAYMYWKNKLNL